MTTTLSAVFDGKVFVPNGPVDLPAGETVEIRFSTAEAIAPMSAMRRLAEKWSKEPIDDSGLPADAAAQHDHYLYGTPKRENP